MQDVILRIYRQTTRGDNNKRGHQLIEYQFEEQDVDNVLGGRENHFYSKRVKYGDECEEVFIMMSFIVILWLDEDN